MDWRGQVFLYQNTYKFSTQKKKLLNLHERINLLHTYIFSLLQENRNVKIAIIDSGIDSKFDAFLCDERKIKEFHDCKDKLKLQDT